MQNDSTPLTLGLEEEYLLYDLDTRALCHRPEGFFAACEQALGQRVAREFYRAQIEVATRVHTRLSDVRDELAHLRGTIADIAGRYGIGILAASMHPFARQLEQDVTPRPRYLAIQDDLAIVGRRLLVCGMHVHVGVADNDERIDLMNQVRYFLPHLLTLSTSSPFFEGQDTGMKGYRLTLYQECPRTGLPSCFADWQDYRNNVDMLVGAGIIQDATKIWWDVRPSNRFPTLEMRITDVCTRVDDAVAVAALYACILRMLSRLRRSHRSWRQYPLFLLQENRWRAMRYGVDGSLFDFGRSDLVAFQTLLGELTELVLRDADAIGCCDEIGRLHEIVTQGTSADRQLAVYRGALDDGSNDAEALNAVVDHLGAETLGQEAPSVSFGAVAERSTAAASGSGLGR